MSLRQKPRPSTARSPAAAPLPRRSRDRRSGVLRGVVTAILAALAPLPAAAQPGKDKDPLSWDRNISGLVRKYCLRCHGADEPRGGVDLASAENPRDILGQRERWESARSLIEGGEMPPAAEKQQPTEDERRLLVRFLDETLASLDCAAPAEPGPAVLRRLNRVEYDAAVLDLTGLDLHLAAGFPPDAVSFGFDTIGASLALSPALAEHYHAAARTIVATLLDGAPAHAEARRQVLGTADLGAAGDRDAARAVLGRFATRAFRRPVDPDFIGRLVDLYDRARATGAGHAAALSHPLTAVLIAPEFLLRIEADRPEATGPYPLDGHELAVRLSFLVWSRPPDQELFELAGAGLLASPAILEEQARRMLADPRSRGLADNFLGQWLGLRELDGHQVDARTFPDCDAELRRAMREEVRALLADIVRGDRPSTDIIDCPHAYVNERLAAHYGLPGVTGPELRRVPLTDRRRGGVLTSAAILMLTADPGRTNVPRRGNYVADRILGDPPPPPPPTVPPLEESGPAAAALTVRERLERHRRDAACAGCHSRIDPWGFSLENFDAIGRWRETEAGRPIDASAALADGRAIDGPVACKDLLLARKSALARTLARNLVIYALGRGPIPEDDCLVRVATAAAAEQGDSFAAMVVAVVRSEAFRTRRNGE
jgi:hypothetical protein